MAQSSLRSKIDLPDVVSKWSYFRASVFRSAHDLYRMVALDALPWHLLVYCNAAEECGTCADHAH
eukprot:5898310-Amphidinium_carterae.1